MRHSAVAPFYPICPPRLQSGLLWPLCSKGEPVGEINNNNASPKVVHERILQKLLSLKFVGLVIAVGIIGSEKFIKNLE